MPGGALGASSAEDTAININTTTSTTSYSTNSAATSVFVGKKLDDHRGAFILDYPMDKGCVTDGSWDAMEHIWNVSIHATSYMAIQ